MTENRTGYCSQGEHRAYRHSRGDQQKDHSDQLDGARADPAPWLEPERREDVFGLLGSCELEEQCLKKDHRDDDLKYPATNILRPGKCHFIPPLDSLNGTIPHRSRIIPACCGNNRGARRDLMMLTNNTEVRCHDELAEQCGASTG